MIGDSETVSHDEFLKSLVEYLHKEGEVRSAQEFVDGKKKLYITIIGIIQIETYGSRRCFGGLYGVWKRVHVSDRCSCKNLHSL